MKIAVTGASGFVGGNVARLLTEQGHEVVPISRRDGVDIASPEALRSVLEGCDGIAHCAGINREIEDQTFQNIHVQGTQNVVEAALHCGVRKIILMSFLRARPDCGSPYHESKFQAEEIVARSGIDYTIIKAGVIYGRGDHMLDHLSHAFYTFPLFGLVGFHEQKARPTAVEDIADLIVTALTDEKLSRKRIPVTGPEEMPLSLVLKRVAGVVGREPLWFPMPVWMHYVFAWLLEKVMKVPLVALAQVRILSETLVEPAGTWDTLPDSLKPTTPFSDAQIQKGLPPPGPFTLKDLRIPFYGES